MALSAPRSISISRFAVSSSRRPVRSHPRRRGRPTVHRGGVRHPARRYRGFPPRANRPRPGAVRASPVACRHASGSRSWSASAHTVRAAPRAGLDQIGGFGGRKCGEGGCEVGDIHPGGVFESMEHGGDGLVGALVMMPERLTVHRNARDRTPRRLFHNMSPSIGIGLEAAKRDAVQSSPLYAKTAIDRPPLSVMRAGNPRVGTFDT